MRKTSTILLVLLLVLALAPAVAMAKTSSEAIEAPDADAAVFTVGAGDAAAEYTWADLTGESGLFQTQTGAYGAKIDGEIATQDWTGVSLADILTDAQEKLGAFPQDAQVTARAADGYDVTFAFADAMDAANRYLVAPEPVRNFDGDQTFDDSFVRIVRGDEFTLSNEANLRCITGVVIRDAAGEALAPRQGGQPSTAAAPKLPGATDEEILESAFYLAVAPADGSDMLYYYYSLNELKAMGQQSYAFNYDDHTVDKTVECNGVFLVDLLDALADADGALLRDSGKLTEDMKIQIVEEDGFHSNSSGKAASFVDAIAYARTTTLPILAWEIKETYAVETEFNRSWEDFRWADAYPEYLRMYRNTGAANSAVCKMVMGAVVSPEGDAYNADTRGAYVMTMESQKNPGVELAAAREVGGVLKGMKIAVRAPEVAGVTAAGDAVQLITVGDEAQRVRFTYEEGAYLTLSDGNESFEMTLSDLIVLSSGRQIPESREAVEALVAGGGALVVTDAIADAQTGELSVEAPGRNLYIDRREVASGTDPYGYGNLILTRYFGAPLKDVILASGLSGALTLNGADLSALDAKDAFVAYKHTCSKATPNNPPEGKRVTETYEAPVIVSIQDGHTY